MRVIGWYFGEKATYFGLWYVFYTLPRITTLYLENDRDSFYSIDMDGVVSIRRRWWSYVVMTSQGRQWVVEKKLVRKVVRGIR